MNNLNNDLIKYIWVQLNTLFINNIYSRNEDSEVSRVGCLFIDVRSVVNIDNPWINRLL